MQSSSPTTFRAKLAALAAQLTRIAKNGENEKLRYAFANESDIKEHLRPLLAEHKLFVSSTAIVELSELIETTRSNGNKAYAAKVPVRVSIYDGESDQKLTTESLGFAVDSDDKCFSKAQQSGIKYGIIALLNLAVGEREADHDSPLTADSAPANGAAAPAKAAPAQTDRPEQGWNNRNGGSKAVTLLTQPQQNLIEIEAKRVCLTPDKMKQLCINMSGGHAHSVVELSKSSASKVIEFLKSKADGEYEDVQF